MSRRPAQSKLGSIRWSRKCWQLGTASRSLAATSSDPPEVEGTVHHRPVTMSCMMSRGRSSPGVRAPRWRCSGERTLRSAPVRAPRVTLCGNPLHVQRRGACWDNGGACRPATCSRCGAPIPTVRPAGPSAPRVSSACRAVFIAPGAGGNLTRAGLSAGPRAALYPRHWPGLLWRRHRARLFRRFGRGQGGR
jgi:hypothetical protein